MLVHELRELRGAEEFFNSGGDGSDIDEVLRGEDIRILSSHTFFNDAFHTGHTESKLILE